MRVVFSDAAEEADEVVLREVEALPKADPGGGRVLGRLGPGARRASRARSSISADALLAFLRP